MRQLKYMVLIFLSFGCIGKSPAQTTPLTKQCSLEGVWKPKGTVPFSTVEVYYESGIKDFCFRHDEPVNALLVSDPNLNAKTDFSIRLQTDPDLLRTVDVVKGPIKMGEPAPPPPPCPKMLPATSLSSGQLSSLRDPLTYSCQFATDNCNQLKCTAFFYQKDRKEDFSLHRQARLEVTHEYREPNPEPGDMVGVPHEYEEPKSEPGDMVGVPAGPFLRGASNGYEDSQPAKTIHLDAFAIDKHEVTMVQYEACMDAGACTMPRTGRDYNWGVADRKNHPINGITWYQAEAFCAWKGKRLPTETEWEKAARGVDGRTFPWGNEKVSCDYAIVDRDSGMAGGMGCRQNKTWPVGSLPIGKSPYGVMDMAGNVSEWTADWYEKHYWSASPSKNPKGPKSGTHKTIRGGSWRSIVPANMVTTTARASVKPDQTDPSAGVRCASSALPTPTETGDVVH